MGLPGAAATPVEWAIGARIDADWDDLDALRHTEVLQLPILLFHGTDDEVVPISTSDELAAELPRWVTYFRAPRAGHTEAWNVDSEALRTAARLVPGSESTARGDDQAAPRPFPQGKVSSALLGNRQFRPESTMTTLPAGERILLIDDQAQMRQALQRTLAEAGYRCEQAGDAGEGRALLGGESFDLVICDLRGSEAIELIDEIEHRHRDTALLMVAGDTTLAQVAGEHGVSGYLIRPFSDDELRANVALALGHAERRRRRRESRDPFGLEAEMLERLNELIVSRDLKTGLHTRAVGELSAQLGEAHGLDPETVQSIRIAAPMHDIGKIGMPDVILMKPSPLTGAERSFIERHVQVGHDLLAGTGSPVLDLAAEIALTHHEHFDGSGYPRGLAGDSIPLAGRIVAIADFYDALVSDRPYREALSPLDALQEMLDLRGARFDPELLDLFMNEFDRIAGDNDGIGFQRIRSG